MGHLGYLVAVMWSCLALAALIGALLTGFWLSSASIRKREILKKTLTAKLRQSEQDRDTRIARLTSELENNRTQVPTLEASLAERGALIARLESEVQSWKDNYTINENELTKQKQKAAQSLDAQHEARRKVSALENQQNSSQEEIKSLTGRLAALNKNNDEFKTRAQRLAAELDQAQNESRQSLELVNEATTELEGYRLQVSQLQEQSDAFPQQARQLDELRTRCDAAEAQIKAQSVLTDQYEQSTINAKAATARLLEERAAQQQRIDALESQLADAARDSVTARQSGAEIAEITQTLATSQEELERWRSEATSWQQKYTNLNDERNTAQRDLARWRERHALLEKELAVSKTQRTALANDVQMSQQRYAALSDQVMSDAADARRKHARADNITVGTPGSATRASTLKAPTWLLDKAPEAADNLQKIRGVGPVMEKTLNTLGIYLYRQLAAVHKQDREWIASHINTFPGRIDRDEWVQQAAILQRKKYER